MDPSVLGPVSGSLMTVIDDLVDTPLQPVASAIYDIAIAFISLGL